MSVRCYFIIHVAERRRKHMTVSADFCIHNSWGAVGANKIDNVDIFGKTCFFFFLHELITIIFRKFSKRKCYLLMCSWRDCWGCPTVFKKQSKVRKVLFLSCLKRIWQDVNLSCLEGCNYCIPLRLDFLYISRINH